MLRSVQVVRCAMLAGLLTLAVFGQAGRVAAQDLTTQAESLKFMPASVSAYSAMLRNGEQWDALLKSKAWAKLNSLPIVQKGWSELDQQWKQGGGPLAGFRKWYEQEDNKKLVALLKEMVRDEIFVASGKHVAELLNLAVEVFGSVQGASIGAQFQGGRPDPQTFAKAALQALAENVDKIHIPEMMLGFRLRDAQAARAQLQRLEMLGNMISAGHPLLKGRFRKTQVNGREFLTLQLDGQMIPWDQVPLADLEENPGEFDKLVKKVKQLKVHLGVGVHENFLLVSFGGSTALLHQLGKGKRLADTPEMQRLGQFANKKLTDIGYASKELTGIASTTREEVNDWAKSILKVLKSAGITREQEAKIKSDFKKLNKDLKGYLNEPGSSASVGFLSDRGAESYSYDWGKYPRLDGSKALSLLHHVGKSPLFAVVSRQKYVPEDYAKFVKWIKIAHSYIEEFAISKLDETAQELYKSVMEKFGPLFKRLDKTTGEMLLPALADGQWALVLDAKLKNKQWHMMMPESEKELPALEPALVLGVSDADLLKKALEEYRQIANKAIDAIRQSIPLPLPDFEIPQPDSKQTAEGTLYWYSIPEILGLDPRLKPTGGLSAKVAVLTISHEHASRLLKGSSLKKTSPLLADLKKPLTAALHLDFEGFVHAGTPWIEYIMQMGGVPAEGQDSPQAQTRAILQIVAVLRSYTSVSYLENDVLVTHGETVLRDLP